MKEGIFVIKPNSFEMDWELFTNPRYKEMSNLAKLIYSVYQDYQKYGDNSFADEYGMYIQYPNEEVRNLLNVTERTVSKARKELTDVGLIEVVRNGIADYRIYLTPVSIAGMFD